MPGKPPKVMRYMSNTKALYGELEVIIKDILNLGHCAAVPMSLSKPPSDGVVLVCTLSAKLQQHHVLCPTSRDKLRNSQILTALLGPPRKKQQYCTSSRRSGLSV